MATRYQRRVPGGKWPEVRADIEKLYPGNRMLPYRMVTIASAMPAAWLSAVSERRLPNSYFFENKFFIDPAKKRCPKRAG